jgi:hypothetical protein
MSGERRRYPPILRLEESPVDLPRTTLALIRAQEVIVRKAGEDPNLQAEDDPNLRIAANIHLARLEGKLDGMRQIGRLMGLNV